MKLFYKNSIDKQHINGYTSVNRRLSEINIYQKVHYVKNDFQRRSYMNNNYENLPAVLNANQLAEALGISRAGAYQLLNTGTFPTLRIGKRLLVPKDKLIEWIERNTGGGHVGG
jgi:hypothetical protein